MIKWHARRSPDGRWDVCTETGAQIARAQLRSIAIYIAALHNRAEETNSEDHKQAQLMAMSLDAARAYGILFDGEE